MGGRPVVAVVGGGPAGLAAAEALGTAGLDVTVWERMPTVGRKLLMAGRGGLNLTHGEPLDAFLARYGAARPRLEAAIAAFPPSALRDWAAGLGEPTFVGSSGRVFPKSLKASPLLRAWLARLGALGVRIRTRRDWRGWDDAGRLVFADPAGAIEAVAADATVLALGGASWPRLGADGGWTAMLAAAGVPVAPLRAANCGFAVAWTDTFRERFAGTPLKRVALGFDGLRATGDAMVTAYGLEGGPVYALAAAIRDRVERDGVAGVTLDLRPDLSVEALAGRLARAGGSASLATVLRKAGGLAPVAAGLLRESSPPGGKTGGRPPRDPAALAAAIKAAPLALGAPQPLARAISTAGGIRRDALDDGFMLRALPGTFACGEMLDWEAPTGGYLLQASFATGRAAAAGVLARLARTPG